MHDITNNILGLVDRSALDSLNSGVSSTKQMTSNGENSAFDAALKEAMATEPAKTTPTQSIHDIVMSAGKRYADLLASVNSSTGYEERLGHVQQLTDAIAADLNAAGYSAYVTGSPDKVVIDGTLYDIVFASKGVGETARMQMLNDGPAAAHGIAAPSDGSGVAMDVGSAIFHAGATEGSIASLLSNISASNDVGQRRSLAAQVQSAIVGVLSGLGFDASALSSPDKITVNGSTYDIIRALNDPNANVNLQAIRV